MKKLILLILLSGCSTTEPIDNYRVDPYTVECIEHELYIVSVHGKHKLEGGCDD